MKIITTKKFANMSGGRDPYKVDFTHEEEKARSMDPESLLGALKDAIEASKVSVNQGKYFDQASVYRKELLRRGISVEDQNRQLATMKSLHTDKIDAVNATHGIWKDIPDNKLKELIQDDRHMV